MNPGATHTRILRYVEARVTGATDDEMALDLGIAANTLRPRRAELVTMGKLKASDAQRLSFAGHPATVWITCDEAPGAHPRSKSKAIAAAAAPFIIKSAELHRQFHYVPDGVLMRITLPMGTLRALVQAAGE